MNAEGVQWGDLGAWRHGVRVEGGYVEVEISGLAGEEVDGSVCRDVVLEPDSFTSLAAKEFITAEAIVDIYVVYGISFIMFSQSKTSDFFFFWTSFFYLVPCSSNSPRCWAWWGVFFVHSYLSSVHHPFLPYCYDTQFQHSAKRAAKSASSAPFFHF